MIKKKICLKWLDREDPEQQFVKIEHIQGRHGEHTGWFGSDPFDASDFKNINNARNWMDAFPRNKVSPCEIVIEVKSISSPL